MSLDSASPFECRDETRCTRPVFKRGNGVLVASHLLDAFSMSHR